MKFVGSRDISHRQGIDCPLRENCHRYRAHVTAPTTDSYVVSYLATAYEDEDKTCRNYWKEEEEK